MSRPSLKNSLLLLAFATLALSPALSQGARLQEGRSRGGGDVTGSLQLLVAVECDNQAARYSVVTVKDEQGRVVKSGRRTKSGTMTIKDLPPGKLIVSATCKLTLCQGSIPHADASKAGTATVELAPGPQGSVTVQIPKKP